MRMLYRLLVSAFALLTFNANATDTYNHLNNQLSIPAVILGDTVYRDVVITVGELLTVGGTSSDPKYSAKPSSSFDTYDPVTNRLTIPNVNAFGVIYHDVVITVGKVVAVGSSGPLSTSSVSFSIVTPSKISSLPMIGSANYDASGTNYGFGNIKFPNANILMLYESTAEFFEHTSQSFQMFTMPHITNDVIQAWASGWTGRGVTISVIDDFNNLPYQIIGVSPELTRIAQYDYSFYGKVEGTYKMIYEWRSNLSHGFLVSKIAGGNSVGNNNLLSSVPTQLRSVVKTGCNSIRASRVNFAMDCSSTFYVQSIPTYKETIDINYTKVPGIAKQALIVNNNVNLSSRQNPLQTVADIQGHLQNSAYLGVINLSLGSDIPTTGRSLNEVLAEVSKFPIPKVNAVITVAAGNGGAGCANQDLNGCNSVAVAMAYQPATAGSTIIVGATSGSGTNENIATYSTRAGILAQRFVLASGDEGDSSVTGGTFNRPITTKITGTSFAAPRVAGIAAILKHKYPSLTPSQIANVILLSASKDINNDGFDDFVGVSPIYGHGKASLTRALSLAGAL
jgi:subtilisin family serine protease